MCQHQNFLSLHDMAGTETMALYTGTRISGAHCSCFEFVYTVPLVSGALLLFRVPRLGGCWCLPAMCPLLFAVLLHTQIAQSPIPNPQSPLSTRHLLLWAVCAAIIGMLSCCQPLRPVSAGSWQVRMSGCTLHSWASRFPNPVPTGPLCRASRRVQYTNWAAVPWGRCKSTFITLRILRVQ